MKKFLLAAGILLWSGPALVWAKPLAADLVLDAKASLIVFQGKSSLHDFRGKAGTVFGKLTFAKDSPSAAGGVEVPVLSLATGNKATDRNMYAMFNATAYSMISLTTEPLDLSGVREGADSHFVVRGILTMHGVSRGVTVPTKVRLEQGRYVCEGDFPVSLKDHLLKPPRVLFFKVADEVRVVFSIVFAAP
jgi:polyisoprenoid-binding protein YceI